MAKPQRITRDGKTYYRVQIRRPKKGINLDEYFSTKREADRFLRRTEHAIDEGRPISQNVLSSETFEDAVKIYVEDPDAYKTPRRRTLKPSAQKDRKNRTLWLAKHCFGSILLKNITWGHIDKVLSKRSKERSWSPASRYRYETTLSRFLEYCKRNGWVAYNVMADSERLNDSNQRRRIYEADEWDTLLDAADCRVDMLGMFLRLAWETGCRKAELTNLRWVDVHKVSEKKLGASLSIEDSKNHENRKVFIGRGTYALLQAHEQQYRRPSSALVFPSRTRAGRYNVDPPFREARVKAKLDQPDERYGEVLSIHHIRHTWATRLGRSGVTLAQLMSAGGWKTAAMAMRYMKLQETQAAEAAVLLDSK